MATEADSEADIFDLAEICLFQTEGNLKGAKRTLTAIRSRQHHRGTNREAAMLKLYSGELMRASKLLMEAAKEVNVVVRR